MTGGYVLVRPVEVYRSVFGDVIEGAAQEAPRRDDEFPGGLREVFALREAVRQEGST